MRQRTDGSLARHPETVLDDSKSKETPLKVHESESLRRGVQRRGPENGIAELSHSHDGHPKDFGQVTFNR